MAGLKSLAKELQSKGRYGDTILAHINPQEAGLLKALGGSGTINPYTGLPEYWGGLGALNPFNPGSAVGKAVQQIPGVKQAQDVATKVFQPVEKAVVQPVSQGLASFDKAVGNTIPGGWGTVAQVAGSMMGLPTPVMVGMGALTGSGVLRPGRSFNLQGAIMGGAMAYGASELAEYARGASDAAIEGAGKSASQAVQEAAKEGVFRIPTEGGDVLVNSQGQMLTNTGQIMNVPPAPGISSLPASVANAPTYTTPPADLGLQHQMEGLQASSRAVGQETIGKPGLLESFKQGVMDVPSKIASGATSAYEALGDVANKATSLDTYSGAVQRGMTNIGDTASGVKNLVMGTPGVSQTAAATAKTLGTTSPLLATGATLYGATGLMALDEQQKYLDEARRNQAISQAEYDQALASINQQRDYAQSVVNEYPFNPNPSRDVSIGETYYRRSPEAETLYEKTPMVRYAMGGSIDDELGGDYSAMGMDQGNMQKGLFGKGYAVGGQIDMGDGRNLLANLPTMSGPIGGVNPQISGSFNPFRNINLNDPMLEIMGGDRSKFNNDNRPTSQPIGNILNELSSRFNQNTAPVSPSLNQNPNVNMGGFAGPSAFYGGSGGGGGSGFGGGGSGGPFPLEGQYGIVKMAAGGMAPRFLSGGGDGMSDSIPATINDKQPARLADGEFVIPADVVSHLGNGSSKAGAKQLYSMMDKVRQARTGRKAQGKQINPRKYMPA